MIAPRYCMFFDNHTMKACPDVGAEFDADEFAATLADCGVDYIGFHAKCNQGFCYYDTETGTRHPSLKEGFDLFGETVRACKARSIGVSAYLNCGLSYENALEHPDWCLISPDGTLMHSEFGALRPDVTPYMRIMCFNSPYRDFLLGLCREVLEKYPVDGFLLDSFNGFPCICPHCIEGMKKLGMDFSDPEDVKEFGRISALGMAREISELVFSLRKEFLLYFLGISYVDNMKIGTYLECECLPTNPCWGYDTLPILSHYLRTLHKDPVLNMTGRFYTWGDFGSLRAAEAVEYDLLYGLANGMRPNIGDHFHPRGELNKGVFERVKKIYGKISRYEEWFDKAKNITEVGVVLSRGIGKNNVLTGVSRMLLELKIQFDFIDLNCDWDNYSLLILADDVVLEGETAERVRRHLAEGKKIISTGYSGLNHEKTEFAFEKEWGVRYRRECDFDPAFFRMEEPWNHELPDMPLAIYAKGNIVEVLEDTCVAGKITAPYYNRHWDGVYSHFYAPPDRITDLPFATRSKQVFHCAYPLFTAYYELASHDLRHVLANMLADFLPEPVLKTNSSLPSFARAFVTCTNERVMIHILNYVPELRGNTLIVEDEICARDVSIALRLDNKKVNAVYLAPERREIPFAVSDGYLTFTLDYISGYAMIVIE